MNPLAIKKAKLRLDKARADLVAVKISKSFGEFQNSWAAFLLSANTIYTSLEQGAKNYPKSEKWFSEKKKFRKNDALLQYLHQARNADDHGIEPVTELILGSVNIGPIDPNRRGVISNSIVEILDDGIKISNLAGIDNLRIEETLPKVALITVINRGVRYPPPSKHTGSALTDVSPVNVASLGIAHFEKLDVPESPNTPDAQSDLQPHLPAHNIQTTVDRFYRSVAAQKSPEMLTMDGVNFAKINR
jgi:hypothetical protein